MSPSSCDLNEKRLLYQLPQKYKQLRAVNGLG
jgi:hypothetical protein